MSEPETYDCLLSHNSRDKPAVRVLAKTLRERGISVWLDEERLRPGVPWQQLLEAGIRRSRSVAVLVGASGLGPWEEEEMRAALSLAVREKKPVIPVLLPDAADEPCLPMFLIERTWVDMRAPTDPGTLSALDRLIWGVTGEHPERTGSNPLPGPPVRRWWRRHPAVVVFSVLALLVLGAVAGPALYREQNDSARSGAAAKVRTEPRQGPVRSIAEGMVEVPAGSFRMGCSPGDHLCAIAESPPHDVSVRAFRIGRYEVTQAEWQAVMGVNPSRFEGEDRPVENVSWNDVQQFLAKLNAGLPAGTKPYRLPTEAEWEYAARAGTDTAYWWGQDIGRGNANCDGCGSRWDNNETAPVGSFQANAFGLYDTVGNVWEWVQDCYHDNYRDAPKDGSEWRESCPTTRRVVRGGSWGHDPGHARGSNRDRGVQNKRNVWLGVRLAQDL